MLINYTYTSDEFLQTSSPPNKPPLVFEDFKTRGAYLENRPEAEMFWRFSYIKHKKNLKTAPKARKFFGVGNFANKPPPLV